MTTMASFLQEQADDLRESVSKLESRLEAIAKELDRHSEHDKEFPLVMRVKGLVDRYKSLSEINELKSEVLQAIIKHTEIRTDKDAYIYDMAKWAMGKREDRPLPKDYYGVGKRKT